MGMAFGLDSPVPFVQKSAIKPTGLPGWYSSPARLGEPSFGFSYWNVPEVADEWAMGAAGEWGNEGYRASFFFYYSEMDSLFRPGGGRHKLRHLVGLDSSGGPLGPASVEVGYGRALGSPIWWFLDDGVYR